MWLQGPSWAAVWHGASFSSWVPTVAWLVVGPSLSSSHFKQRQGLAPLDQQVHTFSLGSSGSRAGTTTRHRQPHSCPRFRRPARKEMPLRPGLPRGARRASWALPGSPPPTKSQVCPAPHRPAQSRVSASAPLPLAPSSFLSALVLSSLAWCGRPSPCCRVCLLPPSARGHLRENTGFQPVAGCDHRTQGLKDLVVFVQASGELAFYLFFF